MNSPTKMSLLTGNFGDLYIPSTNQLEIAHARRLHRSYPGLGRVARGHLDITSAEPGHDPGQVLPGARLHCRSKLLAAKDPVPGSRPLIPHRRQTIGSPFNHLQELASFLINGTHSLLIKVTLSILIHCADLGIGGAKTGHPVSS